MHFHVSIDFIFRRDLDDTHLNIPFVTNSSSNISTHAIGLLGHIFIFLI